MLLLAVGAVIGGCSTRNEGSSKAAEKEPSNAPTLSRGDSPYTVIFTKTGGIGGVNEGFVITTSKDTLGRFNKAFEKSEAYVLPEDTAQTVFAAIREYGFFSFKSVRSTSVNDAFYMSLILELPSKTNQIFWVDPSDNNPRIQRIELLVQKLENMARTEGTIAALESNK